MVNLFVEFLIFKVNTDKSKQHIDLEEIQEPKKKHYWKTEHTYNEQNHKYLLQHHKNNKTTHRHKKRSPSKDG